MKSMGLQRSVEVGGQFPPEMGSVDSFWSYQIPIVATLILSLAVTTVSSIGLSVGWDTYHLLNETNSTLHKKMAALSAMHSPVTESKDFIMYSISCELPHPLEGYTTYSPDVTGDYSSALVKMSEYSSLHPGAYTKATDAEKATLDLCEMHAYTTATMATDPSHTVTAPNEDSTQIQYPAFAVKSVVLGTKASVYTASFTQTTISYKTTTATVTTKKISGIMAVDRSGATPIQQFVYSATSTLPLPPNAAVDKPLTTLSAKLRADMLSLFATASTEDVVSTVDY